VSHIDEDRLHAWLDGALGPQSGSEGAAIAVHLEECEECRSSLEEASAVRERARAILSAADSPPATAPPFANLVAQARSDGRTSDDPADREPVRIGPRAAGARGRRRIPRVGLAWAASIAIAAGAGLLGRELALQRGRDLPAELDFGRESVEAPAAVEAPARQKSEAQAIVEAEESAAGQEAGNRKLDVSERVDADLAEVAAPAAAPPGREATRQDEDEGIGDRSRFEVRPSPSDPSIGHPALGCWRVESGLERPGLPARLWLTADLLPDDEHGALRLETDPAQRLSGSEAPGWLPLGADSVWVSVPPLVLRLAPSDGILAGQVKDPTEPSADSPLPVRYTRVECGTP
jgi:hypothetical protein